MSEAQPSTARWIYRHARTSPDTAAIIEGDATLTYAQLAHRLAQMRRRLVTLGIAPDMLVAVACDDRFAHWLVLMACETIGATTISFVAAELNAENALLARCDCLVFTAAETAYRPAMRAVDIDRAWLTHSFALPIAESDLAALDVDPAPERITRILVSSGTTGAPKGMPTTHRAHLNNILEKSTFLPPVERPRYLCFYRPTVFAARALSEGCLQRGGLVLLSSDATLAHDLATYRPHVMSILTGHIPRALDLVGAAGLAKPAGLVVRTLGAPFGRALRDRLVAGLATKVIDGYGCNEAGSLVEFVGDDEFGTPAAATEIEIVDEAGRVLPRGTAGLIRVKTNRMVEGYLGDPELTARRFRSGWFLTSDIGVMNEAGRLKLIGRSDEVLNLGGIKLSPVAIEEKIAAIPGIRDAAVLARRNADGVEELAAALELRDGVTLSMVEPALRRLLAEFYPRHPIVTVAKLPRNAAGKLQRSALVALVERDIVTAAVAAQPPSTAHCVYQQALTAPNAAAFIEGASAWSYAQLAQGIAQMRKRLLGHGIAPGVLVAVACESRFVHWVVLLACETMGVATISFIASDLNAENVLLARCDWLLFAAAETAYCPTMRSIDMDTAWLTDISTLSVTAEELAALAVDPPPEQITRVLTTSGTTGAPKGMPSTHRAHLDNIIEKSLFLPPVERPRYLCFYRPHVRSVRALGEGCLRRGGLVLLSGDHTLVADLATYRPHVMTILPGHVAKVLDLIAASGLAKPADLHLRTLGAPLSQAMRDRLRASLATRVFNGYGSNETGSAIDFEGDDEFGTLSVDAQIEIVDDAGSALPAGTAGLIKVKTSRMAEGYLGDLELTAQRFKDGWFLTSDIGVMNEAGRCKVIGRSDEVLNLGGIKLSPAALEEKMTAIPGIRDAAVLALRSEDGVDELAAALELHDGNDLAIVEPALRRVLAEFYPRRPIAVLTKLPRNENGKLQRHRLVDVFMHALTPQR